MKSNITVTISKIGALAIIIMSPIFLTGPMILSGWILAAGMLGYKQSTDAMKERKINKNV